MELVAALPGQVWSPMKSRELVSCKSVCYLLADAWLKNISASRCCDRRCKSPVTSRKTRAQFTVLKVQVDKPKQVLSGSERIPIHIFVVFSHRLSGVCNIVSSVGLVIFVLPYFTHPLHQEEEAGYASSNGSLLLCIPGTRVTCSVLYEVERINDLKQNCLLFFFSIPLFFLPSFIYPLFSSLHGLVYSEVSPTGALKWSAGVFLLLLHFFSPLPFLSSLFFSQLLSFFSCLPVLFCVVPLFSLPIFSFISFWFSLIISLSDKPLLLLSLFHQHFPLTLNSSLSYLPCLPFHAQLFIKHCLLSSGTTGVSLFFPPGGADVGTCSVEDMEHSQRDSNVYYLLVLAAALNGVGNTTLTVLFVAYIDENVSKVKSPLYVGKSITFLTVDRQDVHTLVNLCVPARRGI